jgi:chitosanase
MVTDIQKKTAQAIINIFETGRTQGDYGSVTLLRNDPGHLTYGRSQTTLASGNLYLLIKAYCEAPGALYAQDLSQFLSRLASRDLTLDNDQGIQSILRSAGGDPVMHSAQDQFFDRVYWNPAVQSADGLGIESALGTGVVYDSCIHGSWAMIRDMTTQQNGTPAAIGEQRWIGSYVETRKN